MPKIEVSYENLSLLTGKRYSMKELEALFPAGKAELDEPLNDEGIIKVELNDTNRPDLWSAAGIARLLRLYAGEKPTSYDFVNKAGGETSKPVGTVVVDANLRDVRPFIAAFVAEGKVVDEAGLKNLIQTQEKLCWNFGQKRKSIAMGIYRADMIRFPVRYKGVGPKDIRFVPLGFNEPMTPAEILENHPKGQEFGHIIRDQAIYPMLTDTEGRVLSLPPIINSNELGAVVVGDERLFVELTGTDLFSLLLAVNIVACDMADEGYTIKPVKIEYPNETILGKTMTTPLYFQAPVETRLSYVRKLLGEDLSLDQIAQALKRMGNNLSISGDSVTVYPAPYRNDFLHPVDIIEDVMIGRGMNSFEPILPSDFTIGRLNRIELLSRRCKSIMVGLGYQEMIFNYLGSAKDFIWRMAPDMGQRLTTLETGEDLGSIYGNPGLVQIMNPMSENFEFVRNSILPMLLLSESVSANAPYPHLVFEIGKTACMDEAENYGSRTDTTLGFLNAQAGADFNIANSQMSALMFYLSLDYQLKDTDDQRFIPGRRAAIVSEGMIVGTFGEVHPGVLENWGITVPCCAGELFLNVLPTAEGN